MSTEYRSTLDKLRTESVQYYLSRAGWRQSSYKQDTMFRFELIDDSEIGVYLPKDPMVRDYGDALALLVRTVSQVEERPIEAVVKNITSPNVDTLKFRFTGSSADTGSLPLDYTLSAIGSIRESLIFSACGEIQPKPFYSRQIKPAIDLMKKARFGQTQVGSYIVAVEMPFELPAISQSQESMESTLHPPTERRVLTRILRGVHLAREVALTGKRIDNENEFKMGLNANLAESLAALKNEAHDITVELCASWDRTFAGPSEFVTPVVIEERTFETLTALGKSLRGPSVSRPVTIEGSVAGLSRDEADDEDADECTITIRVKPGLDITARTVKVILSPKDYNQACDAHRDRRQISLSGILDRPEGVKTWMLLNYCDFRVLT